MLGSIFNAALMWLLMNRYSWQQAVPEAYKMAAEAAELLRRYGVDVEAGRHILETGAPPPTAALPTVYSPYAPQNGHAAPGPQHVQAPLQAPNPPVIMTVPGQAPQTLTQPPATSQAAPQAAPMPPTGGADVAAFISENFKPQQWAAEGDVDAAQRFATELHTRFGIGVG